MDRGLVAARAVGRKDAAKALQVQLQAAQGLRAHRVTEGYVTAVQDKCEVEQSVTWMT